jgi:hypothetical protein
MDGVYMKKKNKNYDKIPENIGIISSWITLILAPFFLLGACLMIQPLVGNPQSMMAQQTFYQSMPVYIVAFSVYLIPIILSMMYFSQQRKR